MIKDIDLIFAQNDIAYSLCGGTLALRKMLVTIPDGASKHKVSGGFRNEMSYVRLTRSAAEDISKRQEGSPENVGDDYPRSHKHKVSGGFRNDMS